MFESIDFRLVAIVLYAILWPLVCHYFMRKKITPWSGGAFLVMGDGTYQPIDWKHRMYLPGDASIKGILLAGAKTNLLPSVRIDAYPRDHDPDFHRKSGHYRPQQEQNGVLLECYVPIDGKSAKYCEITIASAFPWHGATYEGNGSNATIFFG